MRFIFKCAAFIVAGIAIAAGTFTAQQAIAADSNVSVAAIPGSFSPSTDVDLGHLSSPNMAVEVVLAPSNAAQLSTLLTSLYDSTNSNYQKWLAPGEFNAKFAPSEASVAAVTSHLQANGLTVQSTGSPFLLRARGPSSNVEAAFGTTLHNYINSRGITYFSNTSAVLVPSSVAAAVFGVVGLSSTVRLHTNTLPNKHRSGGSPTPSCETPYVTQTELFDYFNYGTGFSYGYGGGPACSGLTPSQTNAFYGAAEVGPSGKGAGVNFAVFELSAYLHSDIDTWARLFYGDSYTPPLKDINVDGGPLYPVCPGGDTCPPQYNGYSGDIEVDADIEMTLSIAPAARNILVYLAPNDYTGQTELDMYAKIANDDVADVISSSWGTCENDAGPAYAQAENLLFQQIASQGQSMFSSSGDTGAFGCIRTDGTTIVNAADPATQPWVTSVGGDLVRIRQSRVES
jgi:subtilase family serine protease